jgi:Fur family ferric uptake transcriptional regulator
MDRVATFNEFLREKGLKNTSQRKLILDAFLDSKSHYSTEELYLLLRQENPKIGYATVHRTLKLLAESGLAIELNFGDGQARYEPLFTEHHHDHLICRQCGLIIEFEEPRIEVLQHEIAERYHFQIESHRHELYGLCQSCAAKTK